MAAKFPDNNFVSARLVAGTRLMIGEAPGQTEAAEGTPLVGSSGNWLRGKLDEHGHRKGGLLHRSGINDEEVSFINCLNCRPPDNIFPTDPDARKYISREDADAAVNQCLNNHVIPVLRGRPWSRIDLLGDKALRIVAQQDGGVTRWRGSPLVIPSIKEAGPIAVPTLHPAAIARNQSMLPAVVSDLKKNTVLPPEFYKPRPTLAECEAFDSPIFAFDIETDMSTGEVLCVGFSSKVFHAICIPFKGAYLEQIKRIFRGAQEIIGQNNLQFDEPILRQNGIQIPSNVVEWDIMLLQHLLEPDLPHGLDFIGSKYTNKPAWKHLSGEDLELYCCRDVDVTFQCWRQLKPLLKAEQLFELYANVQVPLAKICRLMHETGITLDNRRIGIVREALLAEQANLELQLPEVLRTHEVPVRKREKAPPGTLSLKTKKPIKFVMRESTETLVPWRSTEIIGEYLYNELKLPVQLHLKTHQPTTDKTAIEKLLRICKKEGRNTSIAILEAITKLRKNDELTQTFCKEEMLEVTRVHPHFNVHGTNSGRLSSSEPNLQNIPGSARYIYVPSHPDWRFLEVDYSGIENRLTAWFAQDTSRLGRLSDSGWSEHKWVASNFFGIPYKDVVKDNSPESAYNKAKHVNHGFNYGAGAKKISEMYQMDFGEVRKLLAVLKTLYKDTVTWQEATAAKAKAAGFLTNPFSRRRWFYTQSFFTESLSFLPQSTAADVIFRAMIGLLYDRIGLPLEKVLPIVPIAIPLPQHARLLLQVHDSLLFEMEGSVADEVIEIVSRVMTQPWRELQGFAIPIECKLGAPGASWGELVPIK